MWIIKLVSIVVTVLLLAGQASAVDMCFKEQPGEFPLFVVKNYKKPAPGKCRALAGYEASTTIPYPATGTACLNASGSKLYVHWNYLFTTFLQGSRQHSSSMELPYPSLSNGGTYYVRVASGATESGHLVNSSAYPCVPAPLP
jgi:hypothetical protein